MVDPIGRKRTPRDRGQLLVLGAVALAIVVLGFVAAVGTIGTASSPGTGPDAVVEAELERGIGCLLVRANERSATTDPETLERTVETDLEAFAAGYGAVRSTATTIELEDVVLERGGDGTAAVDRATVRVTSDAPDRHAERTRSIEAGCPEGGP
ncbi:hypothetical protein [Natronococcus occultus]|uniref:Uncharacterized protein n=1 Tax=Natronococcus occultus SP4 TaxID=694430 RepID=L0JXZ2_9EURY|nr:hypothetical protein [Natronococcus occultus]AGB36979.1 hypothetical protein Natoc_1141 [Natronococcus occultus SP4]